MSANNRAEQVFNQAIEIESPSHRDAFLKGACGEDNELRQRVENLIRAHEAAGGFLNVPTPEEVRTVVSANLLIEGPGTVIGRYKLREKIGEGGCGVVYVAEQEEPVRRKVALKVIKLGMDTRNVVARFNAERQALAMMDHPNIAKVLDAGATESGRPYFVMELVRGIRITDYCDQNNLSPRERLDLFIKVCQAIQHAHQKGIIHRDIKPSNILVTLHDGVPVPKVIDFGIAKATEGRLTDLTVYTELHQFIGTPAYMSPEQAEMSGLDIDTRSDIYSLGVLLYELLTGKTPFDAKELLAVGLDEMRRTIREKEPVRPSTRLSTMLEGDLTTTAKHRASDAVKLIHLLRGDLDWIVMKALEKDRTRRYETANGLATDIQRHLSNEPVVARPPSAAYRFQKLVRRNKLAFAAAGAVAGVLVLGAVVSAWEAVQATRARNAAEANEQKAQQAQANEGEAKKRAEREKERAEKTATESLERLVRLNVATGTRLMSEGDFPVALLWFAQALTLVQGDPAQEQLHRLRCASVLQHCPKLIQIVQHKGNVEYAEFSPDGNRIITMSDDQTARVWDAVTGEPITPLLKHSDRVIRGSFSPDGRRVITGSFDKTAGVWNADTGAPIVIVKHEGFVTHAEFSPDGSRILTAGVDKKAQVWDAITGRPLLPPLLHGGAIYVASFSSDGRRIVTASADNTARVWDATNGAAITPPLLHERIVTGAAFSADGRYVVTGSYDWTARVWDATTGSPVSPPLNHDGIVWEMTFSPNGQQVVTTCADAVIVWDTTTWKSFRLDLKPAFNVRLWGHYPSFSPNGKWFVAPFPERSARIYDAVTFEPVTAPLPHNGPVWHGAFSRDNRRLVTASADHTARIWELGTAAAGPQPARPSIVVNRVSSSPDGQWIAISTGDGTAQVLDAFTGKPLGQPLKHLRNVLYTSFSPDGRYVVTVGKDGTTNSARVWNATTGEAITPPLEHPEPVALNFYGRITTEVAFSSDSSRLATTYTGNWPEVRVWGARTGKLVGNPIQPSAGVAHLVFSPDGSWVATACDDGVVRVWNAETGDPRTPPMPQDGPVFRAAFSRDSTLLVTSNTDGTARVWDATTGEPILVPLKHRHPVLFAEFTADATRVMTATEEGAWAWNLPSDRRPVEDIVLQANILTGRRIDSSGSLTPLTTEEIEVGWKRLSSKRAAERKPDPDRSLVPLELETADQEANQFSQNLKFTRRHASEEFSAKQYCLDLSTNFNRQFTNSMSDFPNGRQKLGEVEFDLHGINVIQLASGGSEAYGDAFPKEVTGIKVGRKCQLLHFLQCSGLDGGFFGSYLVHFANGQKWEIPILSDDVAGPNPFLGKEPRPVKRSVVAWRGKNKKDPRHLYQTTWQNPLPNLEIESIDFRSAMSATWTPPILFAITVE